MNSLANIAELIDLEARRFIKNQQWCLPESGNISS